MMKENEKPKMFLATGTGIAPIKSMIEVQCRTTGNKIPTYLFWGLPTYKDVYFLKELKELGTIFTNIQILICLSRAASLDAIAEIDRKYFSLGRVTKAFDELIMKPENDNRKDVIVKMELYIKHIYENYDVKVAIDDRNVVCKLWRAVGLKCLQVNHGLY